MMKQIKERSKSMKKRLLISVVVGTLVGTSLLAGCGTSEKGKAAARKATETAVENQVGGAEDYNGIAEPTLDAVYTQSEEEAQKYGKEMQDIIENGLGADRELQTGI